MSLKDRSAFLIPRYFSPWIKGLQADTSAERRLWILKGSVLLLVVCSLVFASLYQPEYDHRIHLGAAAMYLLLFGVLHMGVSFVVVTHLSFLVSICHIVAVAVSTGGINSTVMVWMTVVSLPAILLLKRRVAVIWGGLSLGVNLLMLDLTQRGLVSSLTLMSDDVLVWSLVHKSLVVCLAMGVVSLADNLRQQQTIEIDQSNQALEQTHAALKQAQAHKEEFMASVGHELRTPMNAILGLNGLLRAELAARPEDAEVVDHIRRSTEQLLQVVNDILDFSQLQVGRLALNETTFPLVDALQDLVEQWRPQAEAKSLSLVLKVQGIDQEWVRGDRQRLEQVLRHLLDNAVKFTRQGGIELRLSRAYGRLRVEVEDTGIGIPPDRQQQVFDRFEFADLQTNRQYGGTGLGLSICERLISLQGGQIGVRSALGEGTTFWFELPWQPLTSPPPEARVGAESDIQGTTFRLLLVDDSPVNLMVVRLMLEKLFSGVDITEARSGAQALALLKTHPFDLVLMDMMMPDMDGLQATRMLRQEFPEPLCRLPVLGLTASINPVDRERCLAAGMNEVLHKPLDKTRLAVVVGQTLAWAKGPAP
jgi:signal transduction histidine kinase/ActR/RegA family two-component response regulator